jgi:CheY-like chemotaxis protein
MLTSPPPARDAAPHPIALVGFSSFERNALASYLRLMGQRQPAYEPVAELAQAQYLVVDADHPGFVDQVLRAGRSGEAVFVGQHAPAGAAACMHRPIDPMHLLRELDVLLALAPPRPLNPAPAPLAPPPAGATEAGTTEAGALQATPAQAAPAGPGDGSRPDFELPPLVLRAPAPVAPGTSALLVDDSEIALRFLDRLLQELGITPFHARTDREALALLARQDFQVVLADIDLGEDSELDGLTLCQRIKREHIHRGETPPPVVLVSAHHDPVVRVRSQLAGSDAFLAKPLDVDELRRLLRRLLPGGPGSVVTA